MAYNIKWLPYRVMWTFHGVLESQDAIQANQDIYGDPRFDDLDFQVVDISGVDEFNVSDEALEEAAAMDHAASISNSSLVVAVVASEGIAWEVAKTYKAAMDDSSWEVKIFRRLDDAMDWIQSL